MKGERPFTVFLSGTPGIVFLCAIAVFFLTGGIMVHLYLASRRSQFPRFRLIVMMNIVTVILIVATSELIVRVGSQHSPYGEVFANRPLNPKNWKRIKSRYQQHVEKADGDLSYIVHDSQLGWTVGPERRSANGLYFSNSEGIRIPHQEMSVSKSEGRTEIALVGDSFAFAEEVRYEESWGYHLGQMLGEKFQVLNYGVPCYGVDQAYLRYEKDVTLRKPKAVLFSIISHDLVRTMWVYPFLAVPQWDWPFSKPRFILRDHEFTKINIPTLSPNKIFSRSSPSELPFLEYQPGYRKSEWEEHSLHFSYLFRLFATMHPEWEAVPVADTLMSVNTAIIQAFVRSVTEAGSIPVLVYFPSKNDFSNRSTIPIGKRLLQEANLPFLDPTPCLLEVSPPDRFLTDHYSPLGNAAVAKCLYPALREVLSPPAH
jgi:hypothetical protein